MRTSTLMHTSMHTWILLPKLCPYKLQKISSNVMFFASIKPQTCNKTFHRIGDVLGYSFSIILFNRKKEPLVSNANGWKALSQRLQWDRIFHLHPLPIFPNIMLISSSSGVLVALPIQWKKIIRFSSTIPAENYRELISYSDLKSPVSKCIESSSDGFLPPEERNYLTKVATSTIENSSYQALASALNVTADTAAGCFSISLQSLSFFSALPWCNLFNALSALETTFETVNPVTSNICAL